MQLPHAWHLCQQRLGLAGPCGPCVGGSGRQALASTWIALLSCSTRLCGSVEGGGNVRRRLLLVHCSALAGQRAPSQHTKDGQASQCQEARWCYDVGSSQARSLKITCFGCAWLWLLLLVTETAGQPLLGFLVVRFAR